MKPPSLLPRLLLALFLLAAIPPAPLPAADLPSVSLTHLYYLQARAERARKFKPDEMVNYCLAQKIGGTGFEYLASQLFTMRLELSKLVEIQEAQSTDPRVVALTKSIDVHTRLLHDEVAKVQDGLVREGQIATDTLQAIGKAQNTR